MHFGQSHFGTNLDEINTYTFLIDFLLFSSQNGSYIVHPRLNQVNMEKELISQLQLCRQKLKEGNLTDQDLEHLQKLVIPPTQMVLYLYSKSTNMRSGIASWASYDPMEPDEPKLASQDLPYASVIDAVKDGWRIVQFPITKLHHFSDADNDYLGYEFILEKLV